MLIILLYTFLLNTDNVSSHKTSFRISVLSGTELVIENFYTIMYTILHGTFYRQYLLTKISVAFFPRSIFCKGTALQLYNLHSDEFTEQVCWIFIITLNETCLHKPKLYFPTPAKTSIYLSVINQIKIRHSRSICTLQYYNVTNTSIPSIQAPTY